MHLVLIIDDNPDIGKALEVSLGLQGIGTCYAEDQQQGLDMIRQQPVDLVIQDMNFSRDTTSGEEGKELFHQIRSLEPDLPIILLTAWTDLETAVALVRDGAADYLGKPWDEKKMLNSVKNLLESRGVQLRHKRQVTERNALHQSLTGNFDLCGAVFASESMQNVLSLATQVASADVPVLISGPNGAGKDVVARIIQANSSRKEQAFVTVNVGALPASLMEAELFGAEAGAYTGANSQREGRFEKAHGGTLFLDEIGNLSLEGQVKLLRVLQTGEYERLGSSQTRKVDVRVISATNADLPELIREGKFREDLFYRLNLIEIYVPPLADRKEDLAPLINHFLPASARLSAEAEAALIRHDWPGNVRELQNLLQRASILAGNGKILPEHLGWPAGKAGGTGGPGQVRSATEEISQEMIERALTENEGNIARTARQLGLSRQALYRRMEKTGKVV
jgi:DNA-binding NtrC family response regulator